MCRQLAPHVWETSLLNINQETYPFPLISLARKSERFYWVTREVPFRIFVGTPNLFNTASTGSCMIQENAVTFYEDSLSALSALCIGQQIGMG